VAGAAVGPRTGSAAGTTTLPNTGQGDSGRGAGDYTVLLLSLGAAGIATVSAVALRRSRR
jgi:hypothetical protein